MDMKSIKELRIIGYGLSMACPYGKTDKNCPLLNVRKLSLEDRISYIDKLSIVDLKIILNYHFKCLEKREGAKLWKL